MSILLWFRYSDYLINPIKGKLFHQTEGRTGTVVTPQKELNYHFKHKRECTVFTLMKAVPRKQM